MVSRWIGQIQGCHKKQILCMGNALVVDLVERMGQRILEINQEEEDG